MKRKGFTLLELMIAAAIVIIISGSTVVVFNGVTKNDVNNAGLKCQKIIEAVRNEAIATREWRKITLHYSTNTITYTQDGLTKTYTLPITVKFTEERNLLNCWINYGSYTDALRYNNDYIYGNYGIKDINIWINPFGKPNVKVLSIGEMSGYLSGMSAGYGYFMLSSRNNTTVIQVMLHSNSGESELRWIRGM